MTTVNLERPLLFFDIESTGLDIASDSIIELSFVKLFPGTDPQTGTNPQEARTWRIRPWEYPYTDRDGVRHQGRQKKINPAAQKVHGISDEDLVDCPTFLALAPEIVGWLSDADLAGFNSDKFDLPLLAEELERARNYCRSRISDVTVPEHNKAKALETLRQTELDLHDKRTIDIQVIYHYMEPRNLRAAYRFYCGGGDFENAHAAEADTLATIAVLKGQLEMYSEPDKYHEEALKNDVGYLSDFVYRLGGRNKNIDYAGRLKEVNGEAVIAFGKHKDKTAREVYESEPSYFDWIANGDFTLDTKARFAELKEKFALEKLQKKFNDR